MMFQFRGNKRMFGVAVVLVLTAVCCTGCSKIAARHIMAPTNGGITELPKTLPKNPLFDSVFGVKVQENPPIGLVVWIIEPQTVLIASGKFDTVPLPPKWSENILCGFSIRNEKDPSSRIHIRRIHPENPSGLISKQEPIGTIIILQGQGGCARTDYSTWLIAAALANAGYRVILPDLRGQGDSTGDMLGGYIHDAKDISIIIDRLQKDQLLAGKLGIMGQSYGAGVAGFSGFKEVFEKR